MPSLENSLRLSLPWTVRLMNHFSGGRSVVQIGRGSRTRGREPIIRDFHGHKLKVENTARQGPLNGAVRRLKLALTRSRNSVIFLLLLSLEESKVLSLNPKVPGPGIPLCLGPRMPACLLVTSAHFRWRLWPGWLQHSAGCADLIRAKAV